MSRVIPSGANSRCPHSACRRGTVGTDVELGDADPDRTRRRAAVDSSRPSRCRWGTATRWSRLDRSRRDCTTNSDAVGVPAFDVFLGQAFDAAGAECGCCWMAITDDQIQHRMPSWATGVAGQSRDGSQPAGKGAAGFCFARRTAELGQGPHCRGNFTTRPPASNSRTLRARR